MHLIKNGLWRTIVQERFACQPCNQCYGRGRQMVVKLVRKWLLRCSAFNFCGLPLLQKVQFARKEETGGAFFAVFWSNVIKNSVDFSFEQKKRII